MYAIYKCSHFQALGQENPGSPSVSCPVLLGRATLSRTTCSRTWCLFLPRIFPIVTACYGQADDSWLSEKSRTKDRQRCCQFDLLDVLLQAAVTPHDSVAGELVRGVPTALVSESVGFPAYAGPSCRCRIGLIHSLRVPVRAYLYALRSTPYLTNMLLSSLWVSSGVCWFRSLRARIDSIVLKRNINDILVRNDVSSLYSVYILLIESPSGKQFLTASLPDSQVSCVFCSSLSKVPNPLEECPPPPPEGRHCHKECECPLSTRHFTIDSGILVGDSGKI